MRVLMTDSVSDDTSLERSLLNIAGIKLVIAPSNCEQEIIVAGAGCLACIAPSASLTRPILEALPDLKMLTSLGESLDHIDLRAAKELGVWVTNVPDRSATDPQDRRRAAIINVLSWLTHGTPTNVVVRGR
jgi:D-3-phosphoglycerate dehydrogenase